MTTAQTISVSSGDQGQRLDAWLATQLRCGRRLAQSLIVAGKVQVDGRRQPKGYPVKSGESVSVAVDALDEVVPEPGELVEVGRGDGWIAVDKPAGMPVHPLRPGETGTVLNRLVDRYPDLPGVGEGGLRSGVVHRLDVFTSGVLLVADRQASWDDLRAAFAEHRIEKTYLALVHGNVEDGEIRQSLVVSQHRPARVRVTDRDDPQGRETQTGWRVLERYASATLLEVRPRTGFLHQIRATLAALGHPLIGDDAYGAEDDAPHHLLHAARLRYADLDLVAPEPELFESWRGRLAG